MFKNAADHSFNRITVDGDTSTNDACILMATGQSGVEIKQGSEEYTLLTGAVQEICIDLAKARVRDGSSSTLYSFLHAENAMIAISMGRIYFIDSFIVGKDTKISSECRVPSSEC